MGYDDTGLLFIVVPGILTSSLYCDHRVLKPHVYRIIMLNFCPKIKFLLSKRKIICPSICCTHYTISVSFETLLQYLTAREDVEHEMFHVLLECKAETMCTILYFLFAFSSWLVSAKRDYSERYFMSCLNFFSQQPV